ncbi:MAG: class III signal peptide-containing protein [Candidatus Omnitrophota bacterium]|jgi:uncharacterized protein (UPF0333 family)|nr:class III signal peptide-containing protein [Candidatus Omnitrophota bacterium]
MMKFPKRAQTAIEYILLFAAVIVVVIFALRKEGFLTQTIENSLNLSVEGLELMVNTLDFNVEDE